MASAFFHTNRHVDREGGARLGFNTIVTGWWPTDPALPQGNWSKRQVRTPFALMQSQKFKW
eukprot:5387255-Prymnesium_polylepis.1